MQLGRAIIYLGAIEAPVLNIFDRDDHLVPAESSRALEKLLSHRRYTEIEMKCGHIGVYESKSSGRAAGEIIASWIDRVAA